MVRKWMPASADPVEFDRQFAAARQAGTEAVAAGPTAASVSFDPRDRTVTVHLRNGVSFTFPVARFPEFAGRSTAELQAVRATPSGHGLHWDDADIHLAVPWLVADLFDLYPTPRSGHPGGESRPEADAIAASSSGQLGQSSPQAEAGHAPEALRRPGAAIREAISSGDTSRMRQAAENARRWLEQNPGHASQGEVWAALRELEHADSR